MTKPVEFFQRDRGQHPPALTPDDKTSIPHSARLPLAAPDAPGEHIRIEGKILDVLGAPCRDVLVEIWQANAGRYNSPADKQGDKALDPGFRGWGRTGTDFATGLYVVDTVKPGPVIGRRGHRPMAPHVNLWLAARGINIGLSTRMYFTDETAANEADPVLRMVEPAIRRSTLLAKREERDGGIVYVFDIRLQGDGDTVFFDV